MGPDSQTSDEISPMSTREGVQMPDAGGPLAALRVLYTLNTSPQYLLARQRRKVKVVPILEDESNEGAPSSSKQTGSTTAKQRYAKVSLKTCLEAVCNASPELICDRSRDYSVYVVDPLESSLGDEHAVHVNEQSPTEASSALCPWGEGVSIGMGLMSWCLAESRLPPSQSEDDQDEGYIVGKMVKDRGADALEIIMSLRETATQTQHQHALSLSSWGLAGSSTTAINSGVSSPYFPSSPLPTPVSSQASTVHGNPNSEGMPETKNDSASHPQAFEYAPRLSRSVDPPSRNKTKKIGRPQGARTHPEKRARQLAIQMHKEKLERLLNIVKMQNGEEYDKTLIIASECASKVTEDTIARERKLLEELQARPLIVDGPLGPRFTTQPLPRRTSSPATRVPLVETTAVKRERKAVTPGNAVASGSGSGRNERVGDGLLTVESSGVATPEEQREAGLLLSLLSSVLGNVDGSSTSDAATEAGACEGNGKGKEKQANSPMNDALANALQNLLPYLPNHTGQPNASLPHASSGTATNTMVDTTHTFRPPANGSQYRPEPEPSAIHTKPPYLRLFATAEESFYSGQRGPNWRSDTHWTIRNSAPPKEGVPKVREDAHPVPGGGWARGRNIVPRASSQFEAAASDGNTEDINALTRPSASTSITAPDKENMPPAKSKRGLKRSFSSSADGKENATTNSPKPGAKKRKEDVAKFRTTKRAMMGSVETNMGTPRPQAMFPASSPVRSRGPMSSPRNLPVVAMSEPEPTFVLGPVASSVTPNPLNGSTKTPPGSDRLSSQLNGPVVASPPSPKSPPVTPPRTHKLLDDDAGESLFTPCATSVSRLQGVNLLSSPSPTNPISHVVDLPERPSSTSGEHQQDATVTSRHVGTGWDLPPSSPPPPTSPILPDNDLAAEENQMDWDFAVQLQSELDVEMEKSSTDGRFEDHGTTTNCAGASTSMAGVHDNEPSDQRSMFEATASDLDASSDIFNLGELGQFDGKHQPEVGDGLELDIDELWSSLGPVIAHAQVDAPEAELDFYNPTKGQTSAEPEEPGTVDPVKLAEDLKALFGGCVV